MTTDQNNIGSVSDTDHDRCFPEEDLLSPLKIRGIELKNRIVVSPMCQYTAKDGMADDWHLVHLGSRAAGGAGLVFTEATAVTAQGRITPGDLGIWDDKHIEPLARIVRFVERMGSVPAIQLAHAGRKASCALPWEGGLGLTPKDGGWNIIAPSAIQFTDTSPMPHELDQQGIDAIIKAFGDALKRALKAGYKVIEIHAAHGYLINEFLSPLTNKRTDKYGGSIQNRMRLLCEIVTHFRSIMPQEMPLFVRISATDWIEDGWTEKDSIELAKTVKPLGVDLIDVSSGAVVAHAKIPVGPGYQVPFAAEIRKCAGIMTGAVGLITEPHQANSIITSGSADLVFLAREFLREPYWAIKAEQTLNQEPEWPLQYGYAVRRRK